MSAPRSKSQKLVKRFGKMAETYQDRIDRQTAAIDRLVAANAVYADLAWSIMHDVKDVRAARKAATEAVEKVRAILTPPTEEK